MADQPNGDLCVMREEEGECWSISICRGRKGRQTLAQRPERESAAEFAIAERARRLLKEAQATLTIHFPDDCPCYACPRQA